MSNVNVFQTKLSKRMQVTRYSTPVFPAIASFEERDNLVNGQSVVRPTFSRIYADTYSRGSDLTVQNYSESSETLTVNTTPAILLTADKFDVIQHQTDIQQRIADDGMRAINKYIDADFLAEVVNASSTVDAGDLGGSTGTGITVDATNVFKVYSAALRKLQLKDVDITNMQDPRSDRGNMKPMGQGGFAVCSPYFYEHLVTSLQGRETEAGDRVGLNGYQNRFFSFDNYLSTNGYWEGTLGLATNPTNGDTVTINGVEVTFVSTLSGGASEIHIASTVDITRANFAEWLNAGGANAEAEATDTGYSAASAADQKLLRRMSAVNDNTADTLTVKAQGYGYVVVSETLTDATDAWTKEASYQMFGQKGATDMVLQSEVGVEVTPIPTQLGTYIKPNALYGLNTFTEGKDALVKVDLNSSTWV